MVYVKVLQRKPAGRAIQAYNRLKDVLAKKCKSVTDVLDMACSEDQNGDDEGEHSEVTSLWDTLEQVLAAQSYGEQDGVRDLLEKLILSGENPWQCLEHSFVPLDGTHTAEAERRCKRAQFLLRHTPVYTELVTDMDRLVTVISSAARKLREVDIQIPQRSTSDPVELEKQRTGMLSCYAHLAECFKLVATTDAKMIHTDNRIREVTIPLAHHLPILQAISCTLFAERDTVQRCNLASSLCSVEFKMELNFGMVLMFIISKHSCLRTVSLATEVLVDLAEQCPDRLAASLLGQSFGVCMFVSAMQRYASVHKQACDTLVGSMEVSAANNILACLINVLTAIVRCRCSFRPTGDISSDAATEAEIRKLRDMLLSNVKSPQLSYLLTGLNGLFLAEGFVTPPPRRPAPKVPPGFAPINTTPCKHNQGEQTALSSSPDPRTPVGVGIAKQLYSPVVPISAAGTQSEHNAVCTTPVTSTASICEEPTDNATPNMLSVAVVPATPSVCANTSGVMDTEAQNCMTSANGNVASSLLTPGKAPMTAKNAASDASPLCTANGNDTLHIKYAPFAWTKAASNQQPPVNPYLLSSLTFTGSTGLPVRKTGRLLTCMARLLCALLEVQQPHIEEAIITSDSCLALVAAMELHPMADPVSCAAASVLDTAFRYGSPNLLQHLLINKRLIPLLAELPQTIPGPRNRTTRPCYTAALATIVTSIEAVFGSMPATEQHSRRASDSCVGTNISSVPHGPQHRHSKSWDGMLAVGSLDMTMDRPIQAEHAVNEQLQDMASTVTTEEQQTGQEHQGGCTPMDAAHCEDQHDDQTAAVRAAADTSPLQDSTELPIDNTSDIVPVIHPDTNVIQTPCSTDSQPSNGILAPSAVPELDPASMQENDGQTAPDTSAPITARQVWQVAHQLCAKEWSVLLECTHQHRQHATCTREQWADGPPCETAVVIDQGMPMASFQDTTNMVNYAEGLFEDGSSEGLQEELLMTSAADEDAYDDQPLEQDEGCAVLYAMEQSLDLQLAVARHRRSTERGDEEEKGAETAETDKDGDNDTSPRLAPLFSFAVGGPRIARRRTLSSSGYATDDDDDQKKKPQYHDAAQSVLDQFLNRLPGGASCTETDALDAEASFHEAPGLDILQCHGMLKPEDEEQEAYPSMTEDAQDQLPSRFFQLAPPNSPVPQEVQEVHMATPVPNHTACLEANASKTARDVSAGLDISTMADADTPVAQALVDARAMEVEPTCGDGDAQSESLHACIDAEMADAN